MPPMHTDPFETDITSPTPFRRPARNSGSGTESPGLRTFRRANAALQAELKYGSARWDDDEYRHLGTTTKTYSAPRRFEIARPRQHQTNKRTRHHTLKGLVKLSLLSNSTH
ncbi:hypothetical protein M3J09_005492 [Ascochyta lentis]